MMSGLRLRRQTGRIRPTGPRTNLPRAMGNRSEAGRNTRQALAYGRCFSRIRVGEGKRTPALIQVDCRGSNPPSAVRRINGACAKIGRGDLLELLTTDLGAVVAALSWCKARGGKIERLESASGAYVLDIEPGCREQGPCTQFHALPYDHPSSRVPKGQESGVSHHPTPHGRSSRDRGGWVED